MCIDISTQITLRIFSLCYLFNNHKKIKKFKEKEKNIVKMFMLNF